MTTSIQNVIAAMTAATGMKPAEIKSSRPTKPVITLSRDHYSGGNVIAEDLAQQLDVPLYDAEILHKVAERQKVDPETLKSIDESSSHREDMWLYRLLSGKDISLDHYKENLVNVVLALGRDGGVIVGRGAHVILARACALRVRVAGSTDVCAERMAGSLNRSPAQTRKEVEEINHNRGKFVWDLFGTRISDASQFDMVVNTDRMDDFTDVTEMLAMMAQRVHTGTALYREA